MSYEDPCFSGVTLCAQERRTAPRTAGMFGWGFRSHFLGNASRLRCSAVGLVQAHILFRVYKVACNIRVDTVFQQFPAQ